MLLSMTPEREAFLQDYKNRYERYFKLKLVALIGGHVPRRLVPELELNLGHLCYTNNEKIVIGLNQRLCDRDEPEVDGQYLPDEAKLTAFVSYVLGHEVQHILSTSQKPWISGLNKSVNYIIFCLQSKFGYPKQSFAGDKEKNDVLKKMHKDGNKVPTLSMIQGFVHFIHNSVEDGRIERLRALKYRPFATEVSFFRNESWKSYSEELVEPMTSRAELILYMNETLSLSTCHVYARDMFANYGNTKYEQFVFNELLPLIAEGVYAQSCKKSAVASEEIVKKLTPTFLQSIDDSDDNMMALQETLEALLSEIIDPRDATIQSVQEKNEEESDNDGTPFDEETDLLHKERSGQNKQKEVLSKTKPSSSKSKTETPTPSEPKEEESETESENEGKGQGGNDTDEDKAESKESEGTENGDFEDESDESAENDSESDQEDSSNSEESDKECSEEDESTTGEDESPDGDDASEGDDDDSEEDESTTGEDECPDGDDASEGSDDDDFDEDESELEHEYDTEKENGFADDEPFESEGISDETDSNDDFDSDGYAGTKKDEKNNQNRGLSENPFDDEKIRKEIEEAASDITDSLYFSDGNRMEMKDGPMDEQTDDISYAEEIAERDDIDFIEYVREYELDSELPFVIQERAIRLKSAARVYFKPKKVGHYRNRPSGGVDPTNIYKLAMNQLDCFRKPKKPEDFSGAVYILIDNSGSMGNGHNSKRQFACEAAAEMEYAFGQFIPMKITAFDEDGEVIHSRIKNWDEKSQKSFSYNFFQHGRSGYGNIDYDSIHITTQELLKRPEKDKLLIVISDGLPCGGKDGKTPEELVREEVGNARAHGIRTVGVYIEETVSNGVRNKYSQMYGTDIVFTTTDEISNNLADVLLSFVHD